jgi:hypothetical protein
MPALKPVAQGALLLSDTLAHPLEALPTHCRQIMLVNDDGQPINGNTGIIHLGDATVTLLTGAFLRPGAGMVLDAISTASLFLRSTVANTLVHWTAFG